MLPRKLVEPKVKCEAQKKAQLLQAIGVLTATVGAQQTTYKKTHNHLLTPVLWDSVNSCGLCVDLDLHGTRKYTEAYTHKDNLNLFKKGTFRLSKFRQDFC